MAGSPTKGAAINMTPFIDVVLVLLVIVMLTAQVAARTHHGVAATLPKAVTATKQAAPHIISALEDGRLFFDQQILGLVDLPAALHKVEADKGRVLIEVEPEVPHRRVLEILDILAAGGVTDASFAAKRKTE